MLGCLRYSTKEIGSMSSWQSCRCCGLVGCWLWLRIVRGIKVIVIGISVLFYGREMSFVGVGLRLGIVMLVVGRNSRFGRLGCC